MTSRKRQSGWKAIETPDSYYISRYRKGDDDALGVLLARYGGKIRGIARVFVIPGFGIEDREAEARIAFLKAVRTWEPSKGSNFKSYVKLLIHNVLTERYRTANAASTPPAVKQLSLDVPIETGSGSVAFEEQLDSGADTFGIIESAEEAAMAIRILVRRQRVHLRQSTDFGELVRAAVLKYSQWRISDSKELYSIERNVCPPDQRSLDLYDRLCSSEEDVIVARIMDEWQGLAVTALQALAAGYAPNEIADRYDVPVEIVSLTLAACRTYRKGVQGGP